MRFDGSSTTAGASVRPAAGTGVLVVARSPTGRVEVDGSLDGACVSEPRHRVRFEALPRQS